LVSCSAYYSTLKMEGISSSEISGSLQTTRRYNPRDCTLNNKIDLEEIGFRIGTGFMWFRTGRVGHSCWHCRVP
jgi:hypothetical protein